MKKFLFILAYILLYFKNKRWNYLYKDNDNKDISKKLESYRKIIDKYYLGDIDESCQCSCH